MGKRFHRRFVVAQASAAVLGLLIVCLLPLCRTNVRDGTASAAEDERGQPTTNGKAAARDWPQWRGPDRDGVSKETGLLKAWPEGGPKLLWTAKGCGGGYSSPIVSKGIIYTVGDIGNECFVIALDLDGKIKWKTANGSAWTGDYPGARGNPTVSGGMVYHLNAHGDLACLDAKSGDKLWSRNVLKNFGAGNIAWALAESVLIDGDNVICRPGGKDACLAAFDKKTGKTVWTTKGDLGQATHSSSISFTFGGIRHIVSLTTAAAVAVNAENGQLLWRYSIPSSNQIIPTPVHKDGQVFITTGDFCGSLRLVVKDGKPAVEELWKNSNLKTYMSGAVLVGGYLYGFHGVNSGKWSCLEFQTGRTTWTVKGVPKGGLVCADGMLYCIDERGTVTLVRANPQAYKQVGQFKVPVCGSGPTWAPPVVCGGRLYVRHGDCLHCFNVSAGP